MNFVTAETLFLTISTLITIAAIISLLRPPLTRLGMRDREYIRMLIRHELEAQLSAMDVSRMMEALDRSGAFDDRTQEPYGER